MLSVVVPAHNSQAVLAHQIDRLMELLPELVDHFEIMIIDDASTDQTEEVALDLAQRHPQVRVVRHPRPMGQQVAIRTGIQRTTGDIVFVQDDPYPVSAVGLRKLWDLRNDEQVVIAQADKQPAPLNTNLIHRLMEWGDKLKRLHSDDHSSGVQMIRRRAVKHLSQIDVDSSHLAIKRSDPSTAGTINSGSTAKNTKFGFHQV